MEDLETRLHVHGMRDDQRTMECLRVGYLAGPFLVPFPEEGCVNLYCVSVYCDAIFKSRYVLVFGYDKEWRRVVL